MQPSPTSSVPLALIAALSAIVGFVGLQAGAAALAGWVFEYPLDDVYIHLAMAESLTEGGYGINAGEPASAASSILYPALLTPFAGSEMQRYMPLVLNAFAVVLSAVLWGVAIARSGLQGVVAVFLAVIGPLALNMPGVGFTGMENSFHAAAALATVLGLWTFLRSGQIGALLILGTLFAPLFRLEGLALSGLACLVLIFKGHARAGLALGLATLAPVLAFSGFLMSQGLAPLPGSVIAKVSLAGPEASGLGRVIRTFLGNVIEPAGALLALLTLICFLAPILRPMRENGRGALLIVLGVAGLAHLIAGQIGWMHRYEHYIIAAQVAGLVLVAGHDRIAQPRAAHVLVIAALGFAAWAFWPKLVGNYVWWPRAIGLQQAQMARFAKDYAQVPVAVNDLGYVAWQNPNYVLDLYGLGSPEALEARMAAQTAPGWAGPLARAKGVQLAMIYDSWFASAVGADWVRLGELTMAPPRNALGDWKVAFYATDPAQAEPLQEKMRAFAETLPSEASLTIEPAPQSEATQ